MSKDLLTKRVTAAREKYAPAAYKNTTNWFMVQLREMQNGECQVIEFGDSLDPRPREQGVVVLARAGSWKELGL